MESISGRNKSSESLMNFEPIPPGVQDHLKRIYLLLCCGMIASAVGVYLHILWDMSGFLTMLGYMGCLFWLVQSCRGEKPKKRVALFIAATLLEGASLHSVTNLFIDIDPSILILAFVGAAIVFGFLSVAAMFARSTEYLHLGGLLSSGLSFLFWLYFATSILGSFTAIFKFMLFFGLLVFVGHMLNDTKKIIEEARSGDLDYVKHALILAGGFIC